MCRVSALASENKGKLDVEVTCKDSDISVGIHALD